MINIYLFDHCQVLCVSWFKGFLGMTLQALFFIKNFLLLNFKPFPFTKKIISFCIEGVKFLLIIIDLRLQCLDLLREQILDEMSLVHLVFAYDFNY